MTIQQTLRRFICENFYIRDPAEVGDDTLLVTSGYVDSTGMLEVIAFLEKEFGIRVTDQETTPENLDSIERIDAFVARSRGSARPVRSPDAHA